MLAPKNSRVKKVCEYKLKGIKREKKAGNK
jgi:hypothetical protein